MEISYRGSFEEHYPDLLEVVKGSKIRNNDSSREFRYSFTVRNPQPATRCFEYKRSLDNYHPFTTTFRISQAHIANIDEVRFITLGGNPIYNFRRLSLLLWT